MQNLKPLSTATKRRIDWRAIENASAAFAGFRGEGGESREPPAREPHASDFFRVLQTEFDGAIAPLNFWMKLVAPVLLVSLAVAIGGGALLAMTPWGAIVSIAGMVSLFGILTKVWWLSRDHLFLQLTLVRYELLLKSATSFEEKRDVVRQFLEETSHIRKG